MKRRYQAPHTLYINVESETPLAVSGTVDGNTGISGGNEGSDPGKALTPHRRTRRYWDNLDDTF